jgi:heme o synthase
VLALLAMLVLGVTGAITALGDTLFPVVNVWDGIRQDFMPSAHFLIGLRIYHPLIAMSVGLYLTLIAGLTMRLRPSADVQRFARLMIALFMAQMGAGLLKLMLSAPIWMQLVHLMCADLLWITVVLLAAASLAEGVPKVELAAIGGDRGGFTAPPQPAARATWRDYLALTKPRVISLLLFTTVTAMLIAAGGRKGAVPGLWVYLAVAIGFYMAAGAANAINMVLERDLDLRMGRTARRPTVTHTIPPRAALQFALALMVGSFALLWAAANLLSAVLALSGLAFYVVVYTVLLKRRTWSNIVIGGAAGAFPPLIGWIAATGHFSALPLLLFAIIFLWTPPHFWALSMFVRSDYAAAGIPMLPVVAGVQNTRRQIFFYSLPMAAAAVAPWPLGLTGAIYGASATALSLAFVFLAALVFASRTTDPAEMRAEKRLFGFSVLYLFTLFGALVADRWIVW